jgi:hypothetical protein
MATPDSDDDPEATPEVDVSPPSSVPASGQETAKTNEQGPSRADAAALGRSSNVAVPVPDLGSGRTRRRDTSAANPTTEDYRKALQDLRERRATLLHNITARVTPTPGPVNDATLGRSSNVAAPSTPAAYGRVLAQLDGQISALQQAAQQHLDENQLSVRQQRA